MPDWNGNGGDDDSTGYKVAIALLAFVCMALLLYGLYQLNGG